jgi:hypothetical protein
LRIKYKNKLFILLFLLQIIVNGQVFDSARIALKTAEPGLDFMFGGRFSFFQNQAAIVQTVGLGLNYDKKISFGICYSWLSNNIYDERTFFNKKLDKFETVGARLYIRYISIYGNLVYHKTKRWKFNIPIMAGLGNSFFKNPDTKLKLRTPKRLFLIYEPAVHVQFKVLRWLGIGANVGFRFVLQKERFIANQLNSPTYALGLSISWDELAKDLFPNNKYVEKLGPKAW